METSIDDIKRRLLVKYPLFGSVVANLKYIEYKSCGTAGTDGKNVYYNPDYIKGLSEDEQTFVFAHEICHVAFDHIFRSEGKDKELWNIATDAVINALLHNDGLQMIQGGVDIPEAINYNAEEMYNKLLEEKQKQQNQAKKQQQTGQTNKDEEQSQSGQQGQSEEQNQKGQQNQSGDKEQEQIGTETQGQGTQQNGEQNQDTNQSQGGQQNQNKDVGHDTHSLWDKAIEEKRQQEEKAQESQKENQDKEQKKESLFDKLFNKKSKEEEKSQIEEEQKEQETEEEKQMKETIKKMSEIGEKKAFNQNKIERKKQIEELREQLAKQSVGAGSQTNSINREVKDIGTATPLIDWRKLLKEAIKVDVDWSYRNASIEEGVVTPHLEEIPKPETEIVLDTSGSINEILLRNFLRECKNILQTSKVKVGCFDTRFYGFQEIRNVSDIDNMQFQGGGGTDFNSAINAFSRRVENKIIFTDGDAPMPDKVLDAIWIVFGGNKINPKGGKVINITNEQLERLYNYIQEENTREI